ncbi:MAG: ATP-binding protein [Gemmatimonadota bacterium]
MDLLPTLLRVSEAEDPTEAFDRMVSDLASAGMLKAAVYVRGSDGTPRDVWPPQAQFTNDLLDTALHVPRPEAFPLGSEFPFDASRFPECEMVLLPLHRNEGSRATCLLIGPAGAFSADLDPWIRMSETLESVERRCERLRTAEKSCEELRRRVEESEALHTLGLAANRTLAIDEVLNLVTRFTRTLLGAQYVTVSTSSEGLPETVASVGLRQMTSQEVDHQLARCVVEAEKPLVIGGDDGSLDVESFPFHEREGMKVGIGLPLSLFGETFGALIVGYRNATEVGSRDIRLALTLAGHAAVAIANARLHERVEQRSQELEQAYDELHAATAAKERFFASINHEIRNPLGAVLGYLTLLEDSVTDDLPEQAAGYLKKAIQATNTLRVLINDLLDLSKIAAGKMNLDLQLCLIADIVQQALDTMQPLADEKGVALRGPTADDLPSITTDAQRVQQILVNLLSNAVKFSEGGDVELEVRSVSPDATSSDPDAPPMSVELLVRDSGRGIPQADLGRIFEEFEQVQGTVGGTGLGLPISRRFARLLGGDLWVESTLGEGSTFVLRLVPPANLE